MSAGDVTLVVIYAIEVLGVIAVVGWILVKLFKEINR